MKACLTALQRAEPSRVSRTYTYIDQVGMKIRDVIKLIERDGWSLVATRGSHRQYKHPMKPGRVTIAGHPADDLAPGTLSSVLKQAQIEKPKE